MVPDPAGAFSALPERADHPPLNRIDPYGYRELGAVGMGDRPVVGQPCRR